MWSAETTRLWKLSKSWSDKPSNGFAYSGVALLDISIEVLSYLNHQQIMTVCIVWVTYRRKKVWDIKTKGGILRKDFIWVGS